MAGIVQEASGLFGGAYQGVGLPALYSISYHTDLLII